GRRGRVHPVRTVRRPLPHRRDHHGQDGGGASRGRPPPTRQQARLLLRDAVLGARMARNGNGGNGGRGARFRATMTELPEKIQGSQAWTSIFRPGSIFRKGYTDS